MKRYALATACFVVTLALLSWLKLDNRAVVVTNRDMSVGEVLRRSDVSTSVISWRHRIPKGTINCWLPCEDRVIGHTVIRPIEKYEPITNSDTN